MIPIFIEKSRLPHKPGVYIFRETSSKVLYVGKAIDLYHRVASYFAGYTPEVSVQSHFGSGSVKTAVMIDEIASVETIVVESELEALILEANLIKKYLPPFNVRLTDGKDYLYIGITKEDLPAGRQGFPRVITLRKQDLKKVKKFFGPFPSARTVRDTLKLLRRVFPWCSGVGNRVQQGIGYRRACFYYHLGLCPGACMGLMSKHDYNKIINRFSKFLEGKKEQLVDELVKEMAEAAKDQRFEEAAKLKKEILGISYLTQPNRTPLYLENPNFLEEENRLALEKLQKDLNLKKLPERIEGYDISNIQGKDATGSLVVLTNGEIDKSQYRKFRIRISGRPNDVGMLKEMVRRRLGHKDWPLPDLIVVDGGRGQVRAVKLETRNWKLDILVFGLAKRMEWLYPPLGDVIKLPKGSLSLRLLQKIRDEAHRFALTYHRKLHRKNIFLPKRE